MNFYMVLLKLVQLKVKEAKTRMKEKDLKCRKQRHTSSVHTPRETNGVI